jgi:hypothetical protein
MRGCGVIKAMGLALALSVASTQLLAQENGLALLGSPLPNAISLENTPHKVLLNGYGVSYDGGEPLYVGALYTFKVEKKSQMLLLTDEPMAMIFYFVRDDISGQLFSQVFTESILLNNGGWNNIQFDKARILELQALLKQHLNAGDSLAFQYTAESDFILILNGKILHRWTHAKTLFNAVLRMWIGNYPPSRDFKRAILNFPISN